MFHKNAITPSLDPTNETLADSIVPQPQEIATEKAASKISNKEESYKALHNARNRKSYHNNKEKISKKRHAYYMANKEEYNLKHLKRRITREVNKYIEDAAQKEVSREDGTTWTTKKAKIFMEIKSPVTHVPYDPTSRKAWCQSVFNQLISKTTPNERLKQPIPSTSQEKVDVTAPASTSNNATWCMFHAPTPAPAAPSPAPEDNLHRMRISNIID